MQKRGCKLFHNKLKQIPLTVNCKTKLHIISTCNNINNVTSNIHNLNKVELYKNNIESFPNYIISNVNNTVNFNRITTSWLSFNLILPALCSTINIYMI